MKTQFLISIKIFMTLTVLTGIIYPFLITAISQLVFPDKANGSFITKDNLKVGSKIIGQTFNSARYFWSRPSAIAYNPLPSGGSNLSAINKILKERAEKQRCDFIIKNKLSTGTIVPSEMIYASASGLDPHISVESAKLQSGRVAVARGVIPQKVLELIEKCKEARQFGFLGEPRINVLLLNLELDKQL
jgi:K+-transporting ATPase ATPase C chain